MRDHIARWCQRYLTPNRGRIGVYTLNGLAAMLQDPPFAHTLVVLEGRGCPDLANLPIATVNVMAHNDHGRNWCMDHTHKERGSRVWHDHCAHVRVCQ